MGGEQVRDGPSVAATSDGLSPPANGNSNCNSDSRSDGDAAARVPPGIGLVTTAVGGQAINVDGHQPGRHRLRGAGPDLGRQIVGGGVDMLQHTVHQGAERGTGGLVVHQRGTVTDDSGRRQLWEARLVDGADFLCLTEGPVPRAVVGQPAVGQPPPRPVDDPVEGRDGRFPVGRRAGRQDRATGRQRPTSDRMTGHSRPDH